MRQLVKTEGAASQCGRSQGYPNPNSGLEPEGNSKRAGNYKETKDDVEHRVPDGN